MWNKLDFLTFGFKVRVCALPPACPAASGSKPITKQITAANPRRRFQFEVTHRLQQLPLPRPINELSRISAGSTILREDLGRTVLTYEQHFIWLAFVGLHARRAERHSGDS